MRPFLLLALPALVLLASAARAEQLKAVVFDIEPSGIEMTPQLKERLAKESDMLRKALVARGYALVDTTPQAAKINENLPLSQCNGCDQAIAKALSADLEVATAVQQPGALAYSLSGSIKDVATGRVLRAGVVDIHGDTDDVWAHGVKFLLKERLFEPPLPTDRDGLRKLVDSAPKPAD